MKAYLRIFAILIGFGLALAASDSAPAAGKIEEDIASPYPYANDAKKAIKARNWDKAIELLKTAIMHDPENAELYNLLGFSERNHGNLDAAFRYYEHALSIDPRHRGAHEYIGEAYLMAGNLSKAEEHLAVLNKLCLLRCEEYSDLKEAVAKYKQQHPK